MVKRELIFFSINSHRFNTFVKIHTFFFLPFHALSISLLSFCFLSLLFPFLWLFLFCCQFILCPLISFCLSICFIFPSVLFWIVDHDAFIRSMWKERKVFGSLTFQTIFFVSTHNHRVE